MDQRHQAIFDKDDRVGDYQHYPKDSIASILHWNGDGDLKVDEYSTIHAVAAG